MYDKVTWQHADVSVLTSDVSEYLKTNLTPDLACAQLSANSISVKHFTEIFKLSMASLQAKANSSVPGF